MKIVYSILAGFGTYALCKVAHVGGYNAIQILGQGISVGALLGCVVTWLTYHNLRR